MMKPQPYCDMDGVLVDFLKGASEFWGFDTLAENARFNEIWPLLSERTRLEQDWPDFWYELHPMSHTNQLWSLLLPYNPSVLTAIPDDGWVTCKQQKLAWCECFLLNFDPTRFHGVYRPEKVQFAKQADGTPNLLIDDFKMNIREWEAAGGIAVHYTDGPEGISKVKEALAEIYK